MSMYRVSDQAAPLAYLRVDVDAYPSTLGASPERAPLYAAAANKHNAAIDLMTGQGAYTNAWEQQAELKPGESPAPFDPGATAVAVESLCIELRSKQDPSTSLDADLVRNRVMQLATIDPAHPVAANWKVLHARTYPLADNAPAWEDVAALVPEPAAG